MSTTHILVNGDNAYLLASDFSDFTSKLSLFALFCYAKQGTTQHDYVTAFKNVKESLNSLTEFRKLSDWTMKPVSDLFKKIDKVLSSKTISDAGPIEIYKLVKTFLDNEIFTQLPEGFKHHFLEEAIAGDAKEYYSEGLFRAIGDSLEVGNYDGAVLDAFKYLDESLRELTRIDSLQIYGEELVNKIFSPNSGLLQLNTHPNEQVGLRNWFSGANAIFRNPLAHRFVHLDEKKAFSAIAMIALMLKIAAELAESNNPTNHRS